MGCKILVVNVHSAQNAGDLALLQMTISELRKQFPDAQFTVSANYPEESEVLAVGDRVIASPWKLAGGGTQRKPRYLLLNLLWGWFQAVLNKTFNIAGQGKWQNLFSAFRESDIVVAVSGNQFFSSGKYGWPLFAIAMSIDLAKLYGKPVYIMPQSIGPFRSHWEYGLLRKTYSPARIIFLRDLRSIELSRRVNLPEHKVRFAPDPAFGLEPLQKNTAMEILEKYGYQTGQASMGATVIAPMPGYLNPTAVDEYYHKVAHAISRIAQTKHCHVFLFNQVAGPSDQEDDRVAAEKVAALMTIPKAFVHVINERLGPEELKGCYGCMDIFLASRLHSGIFALSMAVPTVFIGYLSKTRGILEALDLQENMVELEGFSEEDLFTLLNRTWDEKHHYQEKLKVKIPVVLNEILQITPIIKKDFDRFCE